MHTFEMQLKSAVQRNWCLQKRNEAFILFINVSLKKIKKNGNLKYKYLRNAVEKCHLEKPVPTKEKNKRLLMRHLFC